MAKYKFKCYYCGHEQEAEVIGRVIKPPRCEKCNGFMHIVAEEYKPEEKGE